MTRWLLRAAAVTVLALVASPAAAANLAKVDRSIKLEPHYESRAPRYCLLVFGPEAREHVWLVLDGDYLIVDRNANGYLNERGERLKVITPKNDPVDFEPTELTLDGKRYKFQFRAFDWSKYRKGDLAALDPQILVSWADGQRYVIRGDQESSLTFTDSPKTAPIVHVGGPLQMGIEESHPLKKVGAGKFELTTILGSRGQGPSTFANLFYDSIPEGLYPEATLEFPNTDPKGSPIRVHMQLKHCT